MEEPDPQEDLLRTMSLWLGDIDEVAAPVTGARVESALQDLGLIWTRWDDADDSWFLPYSSDPGSDIDPMLLVELHGAGRDGGARRLSVLAICSVDFALEDRTRLLDLVNDWNVRDGGWPAASVRDLEKPPRLTLQLDSSTPCAPGPSTSALRAWLRSHCNMAAVGLDDLVTAAAGGWSPR